MRSRWFLGLAICRCRVHRCLVFLRRLVLRLDSEMSITYREGSSRRGTSEVLAVGNGTYPPSKC